MSTPETNMTGMSNATMSGMTGSENMTNSSSPMMRCCSLIEVAKDKKTKHDAIYYKLTPYGLFYLFWKNAVLVLVHGREIFKNYKNDKLFHLFLYPCLANFLDKIQSMVIFDHIIDFLDKVCNTIIETIEKYISKEKVVLFSWKKLLTSDFFNIILLDYLNLGLDLKWLDSEVPQIEKREQENMIKILGKERSIIMKDSKDKRKLIVIADNERFHEFELRKNGLIIDNRPSPSDTGLQLDCRDIFSRTNLEIQSLLFSIMHHFVTEIDGQYMDHDCVLFLKDRNFGETLQKLTTDIAKEFEILSKFNGLPTHVRKVYSKAALDADFDINRDRKSRLYDLLERLTILNF